MDYLQLKLKKKIQLVPNIQFGTITQKYLLGHDPLLIRLFQITIF